MSTTPSVEEREAEKMVWEGGGPHTEMWSGGSDSEDSVIFNSGIAKTCIESKLHVQYILIANQHNV